MIRRITLSDRCKVGTLRHGPQMRGKATKVGGGSRSGGVASSMAYRWVIADRIAHWGTALADSNDKLQAAQKHLHDTIRTINNNSTIEEDDDSLEANGGEEERSWKNASGFALFCRDHMEANPHILQRALSAAHSELKSTTTTQQQPDDDIGVAGREVGGFSLRFATTWLIATLHSEYRLLSVEERRRYQHHPMTSSSPTTTEYLLRQQQQQYSSSNKNHHTMNVVDEEEQYITISTTTGHDDGLVDGECDGMDDLQSAYQRARVELERRHQDDLEGLVMYTLSKTQRLMQQHRPDLSSSPSSHHQDIKHPESDLPSSSSMSVMGIDLGDVVQYPPTGFTSFQDRSSKSTRKKTVVSTTPTNKQQSNRSRSSRWAKELAELLKDIPREWASLPRDTRNSWAPNTQRRRKLDEAAAIHKADCERAQQIIDKSLRHFKEERKRTVEVKTSNNGKMKGTTGGGGVDHHKEALQWLLSRRTT